MKVICFYWLGDRWQERTQPTGDRSFDKHLKRVGPMTHKLASNYVNNLYKGVKKWSTKPFDFICFSNQEDLDIIPQIELRPITQDNITKKGVLPRMYMFSEEAGLFGHQVLCMDLDVVITGKMDKLLDYQGLFCTRKSFHEAGQLDGDIMSFYAGSETEDLFWKPLVENPKKVEETTQGRERFWIRERVGYIADTWDELLPGKIVSYKLHVKRYGLPKSASIVSFHGYPRPHQVNEAWIKEHWKVMTRY